MTAVGIKGGECRWREKGGVLDFAKHQTYNGIILVHKTIKVILINVGCKR